MTTPAGTTTAPAPTGTAKGKQQQVAQRPFVVGSDRADNGTYDQSKLLTTGTQTLPDYSLDTDGYTAALYLLTECTGVNTTAVSVVMYEDGPFNVYDTVNLKDVNNRDILGPMDGHDLYLLCKYGGFRFISDLKASPEYSVTSGNGTTGGTFRFVLLVPIEIVKRDALGSVLNKSDSTTFKLKLTVAATTTVWTTPPATSATVRVRIGQVGWLDSKAKDVRGNPTALQPPATGTMMFTDVQNWDFTSGAMDWKLSNYSGGIRTMIFQMRDSAGTRSGHPADWPDPFTFKVDSAVLVDRLRYIWDHMMGEDYDLWNGTEVLPGVAGTSITEGKKIDNGVHVLHWIDDYGLQPGAESRFGYLWTTSASTMRCRGTVGATGTSHKFRLITNYVNPPQGIDPRALTGGR